MPPSENTNADTRADTHADTHTLGRRMGYLAVIAFLGLMWVVFGRLEESRQNPNHNVIVAPGASSELVLKRNVQGHYVVPGTINGHPVTFMLDTGASTVAIPLNLREQLALQKGQAFEVSTANGVATAYRTTIDGLAFGPFVIREVEAGLSPGMDHDNTVLLGMNVLKRLKFTQEGDMLILKRLE